MRGIQNFVALDSTGHGAWRFVGAALFDVAFSRAASALRSLPPVDQQRVRAPAINDLVAAAKARWRAGLANRVSAMAATLSLSDEVERPTPPTGDE